MAGQKVLVDWINEGLTGIEDISSVPEDSRHVGAIAQVLWAGTKKRYPAKIVMISDNMSALESEEAKVIADRKNIEGGNKRKRGSRKEMGKATDEEVLRAVGDKCKPPKHLQLQNSKINTAKKRKVQSVRNAEYALEMSLLDKAKKNSDPEEETLSQEAVLPTYEQADQDDSDLVSIDHADILAGQKESMRECIKFCSCAVCVTLKKSDNDVVRMLLKSLYTLFFSSESEGIRYLKPLEVSSKNKVELTKGKGVYISSSDKNQIKVDCANKPNQMIKETLFAIFGKEAFKKFVVTARGQRPGSFGIEPHVLAAILGFVNRNVDEDHKITQVDLVANINKRAVDWRSPTQKTASKTSVTKRTSATLYEGEHTSALEQGKPSQSFAPPSPLATALSSIVTSGALETLPPSLSPSRSDPLNKIIADAFALAPPKESSTAVVRASSSPQLLQSSGSSLTGLNYQSSPRRQLFPPAHHHSPHKQYSQAPYSMYPYYQYPPYSYPPYPPHPYPNQPPASFPQPGGSYGHPPYLGGGGENCPAI